MNNLFNIVSSIENEYEDIETEIWFPEKNDIIEKNNILAKYSSNFGFHNIELSLSKKTKVKLIKRAPYKYICLLKIKENNGTTSFGTGFFISSKCIITTGHNLYTKEFGWANHIEIIPSIKCINNSIEKPFGYAISHWFNSIEGWTIHQNKEFDIGAIFLTNNAMFSRLFGYFNFAVIEETKKDLNNIETAGYLKNNSHYELVNEQGHWLEKETDFSYQHSMPVAQGMAGSPIWGVEHPTNPDRFIVNGINAIDQDNGIAIKITNQMRNVLVKWKNKP